VKPSPIVSIIMFVGAAMVLFAIVSTGWFNFSMDMGEGDSVSNAFGVLRSEGCYKGRCESALIFKNMRLEPEMVFAILTLITGLTSAVFGVIAGIFLLKPRRSALSLVTLIVAGVALLCALLFIVLIKVKTDRMGVSYAAFIFLLGVAGLITASIMAMIRPRAGVMPQRAHAQSQPFPQGQNPYGQQSQPYQQQPQMHQPQQQPQYSAQGYPQQQQTPQPQPQQQSSQSNPQGSPPCPTCGQAATWVAQYNRWFCTRENKYL